MHFRKVFATFADVEEHPPVGPIPRWLGCAAHIMVDCCPSMVLPSTEVASDAG